MSAPSRAVFLSYASQDAPAAARLCEALRQAGLEVWFDKSELRGGDAWDASIRQQIRTCSLLIPIISANTEARTEGYFRREWKLATERMLDMADDRPFLLPVVIDATPESAARVPDAFRERQWTRCIGGNPPIKFVERVRHLLDTADSSVPAPVIDTERRIPSPTRRGMSRTAVAGAVIAVLVVLTVTFAGDVRQSVARLWNGSGTASTQRPFRSFAVLPVTFESSELQQRDLASKLTDELTALVGRTFPEGLVISSGLARHHSSGNRDPRKIGQELNVRYLIMGRLHPVEKGDELGVEFVDIEDGARLWTDRFIVIRGGDVADSLGRIGNELRHAADMAARKEVASLPEPKRTAWNLVLQSWELDGSQPSIIKGQKLNEEALRLDPNLVPALYELAGALRARIGVVEPEKRKESIARLDEISVRAVAVAPNDPRAWILRSVALMWQGNSNGAFAASDEALRLDPFRSDGLIERARLLALTGRGNEALEILARIIVLSPSEKITVLAHQCWISVTVGRDRDAIAPCETAAAANRYWLLYAYACAAHANVGDLDKAAYWKQKLIADYPNFSIKRFQNYRISDDRVYLAQREHYYDGLRKAGIPEK